MMIKNRPTTGIYGSIKSTEKGSKFKGGFGKKKDSFGYNAHANLAKKGGQNRNILKAKMEIRTNSDSNDNEYNLILGHPDTIEKGKMVFSPVEGSNLQIVPRS